ncbi:MAG: ATP-binding protein [Bacteroidales bacterium]
MSESRNSLEIPLFKKTLLMLSVIGFCMGIINLVTGISEYVTAGTFLLGIVCVTCYFLVKNECWLQPIKYTLTIFSFILIVLCWFLNNQSYGPMLAFFVMWTMFVIFLWDYTRVVLFLSIALVVFIALGITDYMNPYFTAPYESHSDRVVDMYLGVLIVLAFVMFYGMYIKHAYNRKMKELQQAESLKTAFLQNISHEIRTPMNAIIGFSELLQSQNLSTQNKLKYVETIHTSGKHLMSIIDDIMNISMLDAGQVKVVIKPVWISKLLFSLYEEIKIHSLLDPKVIVRSPIIDLEKDYYIMTDEVKLRQVLQNLLINAIKFTHVGYIEFGCRVREVNLEFYVKDTGIGIEEDKKHIIFDRFTQVEKTNHSRFKGAGLGLSICKSYVDLMGGSIGVRSQKGNGSVFYFSIPFDPVRELDAEQYANAVNAEQKKTILIAEDEDINYEFLNIVLGKQYNLLRAVNGQEAVDIMNRQADQVDCILMDIKMPALNGIEAAKIIKRSYPDVYIIAQTAVNQIQTDFNISHTCFDDYILKPINPQNLHTLLYTLLE